MYNEATREKFNVLIFNLDKSGNERYRRHFTDYYTLEIDLNETRSGKTG
jgi:hypothetical protein